MSDYVAGVDGCPGGWLACRYEHAEARLSYNVHANFADLLLCYAGAQHIAVDIPIGLTEDGLPRGCDREARLLLGAPRASSVFPAPARCVLTEPTYLDASRRSFAACRKR